MLVFSPPNNTRTHTLFLCLTQNLFKSKTISSLPFAFKPLVDLKDQPLHASKILWRRKSNIKKDLLGHKKEHAHLWMLLICFDTSQNVRQIKLQWTWLIRGQLFLSVDSVKMHQNLTICERPDKWNGNAKPTLFFLKRSSRSKGICSNLYR